MTAHNAKLNFGWSHRLSLVLQSEEAECGLACLPMLAAYHGFETDLASFQRRFSLLLEGVRLNYLCDPKSKLGVLR